MIRRKKKKKKTTFNMTCFDWLVRKIILVVDLCKSDVILIITYHLNKFYFLFLNVSKKIIYVD
jgi:hypothetical protein